MQQTKREGRRTLGLILLAALALRVVLACMTPAYPYDQSCFFGWAYRMADAGPAGFYAPDYFADYPPGYMLVLGLVGHLLNALHLSLPGKGAVLLMALPPILCDLGLAALVWHIGGRHLSRPAARRLTLLAAFCPALLYDTAVWKQIDGVLCLCMALTFWLLEEKQYLPAALLYGVGLAIKPQALLIGPVLALCFLEPLVPAPGRRLDRRTLLHTAGQGAAGVLAALAPVLLCALPFAGAAGAVPFLLEKYFTTTQNYTYAAVNAFNLFGALGANWEPQDTLIGFFSWQGLGSALLVLLTVALAVLALRSSRAGRFSPLTLAAFYAVGVFTLGHRMHERYLLLGLALLICAAARWGDRRLTGCAAACSITALLNQAVVYSQAGTEDEFLSSASSQMMMLVVGLAQVLAFAALACAVWAVLVRGEVRPLTLSAPAAPSAPAPQPRWTRREAAGLALLTLFTAIISFAGLGDHTAPQTLLDARSQTVSGQVAAAGEPSELWVYSGISDSGTLTVRDGQGAELARLDLGHVNTFCWKTLTVPALPYYSITVEHGSVVELGFRDAQGALLPVEASGALLPAFDEQALIPEEISYRNSMYFDEIYHARTAYEQLHRLPIYETTHPPLGKVFIMLGVALFGMTGFGWRCAGAAFGVAMVPVLYLLTRRLTRRPPLAGLAALLLALDGLRFAQSRIATIDVYGAFFILLSAYFMVWYCQSVLEKGVRGSVLPMALSGLAFGLGAASKWTGIYAGAGLAVLFFGVLWLRSKQKQPGFSGEFVCAIGGGVAFFVVVPLVIYLGSYFVYAMQDPGFGLADWWSNQLYMFDYHKNLDASHSFASNWYTWPLMLRPVWYYLGGGLPAGEYASIAGMGNPIVWWAGTAAVLALFWRQFSGRATPAGGAVTVLYLTQLLPWTLVPRCTFLYHYLPSLGFAVIAIALLAQGWGGRTRRRCAVLAVLAALAFVVLLPPISGMAVPAAWAKMTLWLPSWGFYGV